jgi:hypothetical protein
MSTTKKLTTKAVKRNRPDMVRLSNQMTAHKKGKKVMVDVKGHKTSKVLSTKVWTHTGAFVMPSF